MSRDTDQALAAMARANDEAAGRSSHQNSTTRAQFAGNAGMAKQQQFSKPLRAILDLQKVETKLRVSADLGKTLNAEEMRELAGEVNAAYILLQHTILQAAAVLENGPRD